MNLMLRAEFQSYEFLVTELLILHVLMSDSSLFLKSKRYQFMVWVVNWAGLPRDI
jgi:hypothetical protein